MQNIVHPLKNNLDFTIVLPIDNVFEVHTTIDKIDGDEEFVKFVELREKRFEELDTIPSPRLIKSHLLSPAYLLPKELWTVRPKLIHMNRDIKDIAVSYYHIIVSTMIKLYCRHIISMFKVFVNFNNWIIYFL